MTADWVHTLSRSNRLEQRVAGGGVALIVGAKFDAMLGVLELSWTNHPERATRDGQLRFRALSEVNFVRDGDDDSDETADLIGLDEYADEGFTRYVVRTTAWEITFATVQAPEFNGVAEPCST